MPYFKSAQEWVSCLSEIGSCASPIASLSGRPTDDDEERDFDVNVNARASFQSLSVARSLDSALPVYFDHLMSPLLFISLRGCTTQNNILKSLLTWPSTMDLIMDWYSGLQDTRG